MADPYDHHFSIFVIGNSQVGKTEVLQKFSGHASKSKIGVECRTKIIEVDGRKIKLRVWDTPGREWLQAISGLWYLSTQGFMLVYDITNHDTFQSLRYWMEAIREVYGIIADSLAIMLIETNCHLENRRAVPREEALQFATQNGMKFMEVSAKKNINMDKVFYTLARDMLAVFLQREQLEQPRLSARPQIQDAKQPKQSKGFFSSVRQFVGKLGRKREQTNSQPPLLPSPPPSPETSLPRLGPRQSPPSSLSPQPSLSSLSSSTSGLSRISVTSCSFVLQDITDKAPPEILARGPLALRAYNNALSEGKTCVKRVPIMLIGQDRSGKTSLKKSLRGMVFNPDEDSTVGIDVDPSHFKVSTEVWKAGKKDQQSSVAAISYEHHAAQLIFGTLMGEETVLSESVSEVSISSSSSGQSFASSESQEPDERGLDLVQSGSSLLASGNALESSPGLPSKFPNMPNSSELHIEDTSIVPEEIATLVERLLQEVKTVEDDKDVYSILWDFGGQSVYYVTHPLFLTSRAIYLLVYDLSRNPHDKANPLVRQGMFKKIEDNFSLKTNLDYLDFWMTSVASLSCQSGQQSLRYDSVVIPTALPPVFLVCTHSDEPYGDEDPCTVANGIFHFLQNKPYSVHLFEHVFVVDNTKSGGKSECPEVSRLRQNLLAVAKDLPQMKEAIPIKWLQFEKALQVTKEQHEWITLETAKEIASEVCKIDDDQEIVTLLNFLHDQRILIHFDDTPELNKLVVLNPQWLIDVFKKVITVKPYDHEEREFKDLWQKLEQTGILDQKLLEHAWGALLDQEETADSLIAIMEKFSLMCLWPSSDASCDKQYLVPSMLMSHPPQGIMELLESAQIPSLFLKFQSRQIPPSLFPRLVLQFCQWCTDEFPGADDPQLYHNFARFYISQDVGCSVVLLCHPSSIEVVFLSEDHDLGLHEVSQSTLSLAEESQRTFELMAARAVRRQLILLLDCMKKEFCWLNNITCEVCFLCPACSRGGSVTYCQTHHAQGCSQEECLHFWPESDLCNVAQTVICRKSADAVKTRVQVKQFTPWVILPNKKQSTLGKGRHVSLLKVHEEEIGKGKALAVPLRDQGALPSQLCDSQDGVVRLQEDLQLELASLVNPEPDTQGIKTSEGQALALPFSVEVALLSCSCDAQEVVNRLQEDLQLEQSSLKHPEPKTKRMIRCLARKAKCSSRLDVVKRLREVTPAGTAGPLLPENLDVQEIPLTLIRDLSVNLCGGDEWMVVAERLGLKPSEIRFLDKRSRNPFESALIHSRNQQYWNVGQLYDVLVDCGCPGFSDLL